MSDFLERLNRRLRRKQAEEPIRGSDESEEAGAPELSPSPAAPPLTAPAPEPAAASLPAAAVPRPQTKTEQPVLSRAGGKDIALVFAPDGPVARLLGSSYRPRRGQALMARLVKRALDE